MNMQQMMAQAQKIQRELNKAHAELAEKEFSVTKGGAVTVTMLGSGLLKSVTINEEVLEKENKEMLEDMIALAFNEVVGAIEKAKGDINERITGSRSGLGL